jgi:hypothetical protein
MREHADLAAMMGFVRKHVAEHFHAHRPRLSPAISVKLFDAAAAGAERFREHFSAASGALGQCRTGLLWSAVRAVELPRNFQVPRSKPDPLGADVVHVSEDGGNGAGLAGRFGVPDTRVEMFDKHLVHALIDGKDLDCGSAELSLGSYLTGGPDCCSWTHISLCPRIGTCLFLPTRVCIAECAIENSVPPSL